MTFEEQKKKLNQAFVEFRQKGISAKYVPRKSCSYLHTSENVVTYQKHDLDILKEQGILYLTWSGDIDMILKILREYFENVKWNGECCSRIKIKF